MYVNLVVTADQSSPIDTQKQRQRNPNIILKNYQIKREEIRKRR